MERRRRGNLGRHVWRSRFALHRRRWESLSATAAVVPKRPTRRRLRMFRKFGLVGNESRLAVAIDPQRALQRAPHASRAKEARAAVPRPAALPALRPAAPRPLAAQEFPGPARAG